MSLKLGVNSCFSRRGEHDLGMVQRRRILFWSVLDGTEMSRKSSQEYIDQVTFLFISRGFVCMRVGVCVCVRVRAYACDGGMCEAEARRVILRGKHGWQLTARPKSGQQCDKCCKTFFPFVSFDRDSFG